MLKDFWFGLIVTVLFPLVMFGWVFFSTDKKTEPKTSTLSSQNLPFARSRGIWSSLSTLEEYNYGAVEEIKDCFDEYKGKLKEYEFAISEAQNRLDEAYGNPSPNYGELFDIIEATHSELDISLTDPYCY